MHIILINVPSRKGEGGKFLPIGLLYLGGIVERCGHSVSIIDPYCIDPKLTAFDQEDYSDIDVVIKIHHSKIICFGGISSSYGRTKKLSKYIHLNYPGIFQIAGGPLASVYELLLHNTSINLVFHGETENTFPLFLDKFENNENWEMISGVSYLRDYQIIRNPNVNQIENLDTIPFPSYHLVKLEDYYDSMLRIVDSYSSDYNFNFDYKCVIESFSSGGSIIPLMTSRGCTNKCSFCYRHMKGYRQHSVSYVISHIKFLNATYGIRGFNFADEFFNYNKEWVIEFCDAIDHENLDIYYLIAGARVDKIDEEMLKRLKKSGCVYIAYGQESGSNTILKEYRKGVTARQNLEITLLSKECGLICPVQIVIGSPGETQQTIDETIKFIIDSGSETPSLNYLLPFPETPIWKYVTDNKLIPDIEKYLDDVAEMGGCFGIVNLTQVPNYIWQKWIVNILNEIKLNSFRKKGQYINFIRLYLSIRSQNFLFIFHRKILAYGRSYCQWLKMALNNKRWM